MHRPTMGMRLYRGLILVVALVLLATAPLAANYVINSRRDAEQSPNWPSVEGTIRQAFMESQSRKGKPSVVYRPLVEYDYSIKGQKFLGNRITAAALHKPEQGFEQGSQKYAELKIAQYAAGTSHRVYYDPADPARSVLETGIGAGHDASLVFIAGMVGVSGVLLYTLYGTKILR